MISDDIDVLVQSFIISMTSTIRLFLSRKTTKLDELYQKMESKWRTELQQFKQSVKDEKADFSRLRSIEGEIRKYYYQLCFQTTHRHGNLENRRIQFRDAEDQGPLNRLFDIAGRILRDISVLYPFAEPDGKSSDGKSYYISKKYGKIELVHPKLPELDFVDMIRTHMIELCRQLFICNVPEKESRRYLNLLVYRLQKFLDYVYLGGRQGVHPQKLGIPKDFDNITDMDKELRKIVNEIHLHFNYDDSRLSNAATRKEKAQKEYDELIARVNLNAFFKEKKIEERYYEYFQPRDLEKLLQKVKQRSAKHGTLRHQEAAWGVVQPYRLEDIMNNGDLYVDDATGYLLAAEVVLPGKKGNRRPDYIVFKKIYHQDHYVWIPIVILDLKTKHHYEFDFQAKKTKSKFNRYVPDFIIQKRDMSEEEWEVELQQILIEDGPVWRQLEDYSTLLHEIYLENEIQLEPIIQGVIIDGNVKLNSEKVKLAVYQLLDDLHHLAEVETSQLHINLGYQSDMIFKPIQSINTKDAEEPDVKQQRFISPHAQLNNTLYLQTASRDSAGHAQSWISTFHHLLAYMDEYLDDDKKILLLDISNELNVVPSQRILADADLNYYLDRIDIQSISYIDSRELDSTLLDYDIIIVSGYPRLKKISEHNLEEELLKQLSQLNLQHLYFIDTPVVDLPTSRKFKRRTVIPWHRSDEFRPLTYSRIIWNLPLPIGKYNLPCQDNRRIILHHEYNELFYTTIQVDVLKEYSARFTYQQKYKSTFPNSNDLLQLVPWLELTYGLRELAEFTPIHQEYAVIESTIKYELFYPHLHYNPDMLEQSNKNWINSTRRYRRANTFKHRVIQHRITPPLITSDSTQRFRLRYAAKTELRRLRKVILFLRKYQHPRMNDLLDYIGEADDINIISARLAGYTDVLHVSLQQLYNKVRQPAINYSDFNNNQVDYNHSLLYGNYLYLLFYYLALTREIDNHLLEEIMKKHFSWVIQGMGINLSSYNFNIYHIFSNLSKRTNVGSILDYNRKTAVILPEVEEGFLQFSLWDENCEKMWMVIQRKRGKIQKGLINTLTYQGICTGELFYSKNHFRFLKECKYHSLRKHIFIYAYRGKEYLYLETGDKWQCMGQLRIIESDNSFNIKSIYLYPLFLEDIELDAFEPNGFDDDYILELVEACDEPIRVWVNVDINGEDEYRVTFINDDLDFEESITTIYTQEVIQILTSSRNGVYVINDQEIEWNHFNDIQYNEKISWLKASVNDSKATLASLNYKVNKELPEYLDKPMDEWSITVIIGHDNQRCTVRKEDRHIDCYTLSSNNEVGKLVFTDDNGSERHFTGKQIQAYYHIGGLYNFKDMNYKLNFEFEEFDDYRVFFEDRAMLALYNEINEKIEEEQGRIFYRVFRLLKPGSYLQDESEKFIDLVILGNSYYAQILELGSNKIKSTERIFANSSCDLVNILYLTGDEIINHHLRAEPSYVNSKEIAGIINTRINRKIQQHRAICDCDYAGEDIEDMEEIFKYCKLEEIFGKFKLTMYYELIIIKEEVLINDSKEKVLEYLDWKLTKLLQSNGTFYLNEVKVPVKVVANEFLSFIEEICESIDDMSIYDRKVSEYERTFYIDT